MDFNLIETFNESNCGIKFDPKPVTTNECKKYSDQNYSKLRSDYLEAILAKFDEAPSEQNGGNKKCLIKLLFDNIDTSQTELKKHQEEEEEEEADTEFDALNNIIGENDEKKIIDEIEDNVALGKQRIKENDDLIRINNIKYYVSIVGIIVLLIIELILIKL